VCLLRREHNATRGHFQFVGASFIDVRREIACLAASRPRPLQRWPTATVRGTNVGTPAFDKRPNQRRVTVRMSVSVKPALNTSTSEKGDESMRAGKLITLSAVAVLVGGTSLATGLASGETSPQSSSSMQGRSLDKGSARSFAGHQPSQRRQSIAPSQRTGAYARASTREFGEARTGTHDRTARVRETMRNIPRVSSIGTNVRIDAVVPRSVRQAAVPLPPEVQRMEPRFRNDRVFKYRDQVVIVNPATSRIVAIVKAPT
jgi:hypothetical protein